MRSRPMPSDVRATVVACAALVVAALLAAGCSQYPTCPTCPKHTDPVHLSAPAGSK